MSVTIAIVAISQEKPGGSPMDGCDLSGGRSENRKFGGSGHMTDDFV